MINAKYFIIFVVMLLVTGCANKRFYIGFDDYGETRNREESWQTGEGRYERK